MNIDELYRAICDAPFLRFIDDDAEEVFRSVVSGRPDFDALMTESAAADIKRAYRMRVETLYASEAVTLISGELQGNAVSPGAALANADEEQIRRAAEAAALKLGRDPASSLREKLVMLPAFEERIRANYIEAQREFLDRLLRYRSEISGRFFGGREITRIEALTGISGDKHRHGRSVAGIVTDAGTFYYKPHDCRMDSMYHELVVSLFPDCTLAADCVNGDGCGFVSEIRKKPLDCQDEAHEYYYHFGMLTALFHAIGASDMHFENILPAGTKPAAIDLETMLRPERELADRSEGASERAGLPYARELAATVMNTNVMPVLSYKLGMASPLYESTLGDYYLPFMDDGKRFQVTCHESDFIRGFDSGYSRMMDNRDAVRDILSAYGDAEIRYLMRNSTYYGLMLRDLYRSENLRSRSAQQAALGKLRVPFTVYNEEVDEAVVEYEAACLLEGDVPYYCASLDGHELCGASPVEVLHEGYMRKSAREKAFEMLERLSDSERSLELTIIRNAFEQVPLSDERDKGRKITAGRMPAAAEIAAMAEAVNGHIVQQCIHTGDGSLVWQSPLLGASPLITIGTAGCLADVGAYAAMYIRAFGGGSDKMSPDMKTPDTETPDMKTLAGEIAVNIGGLLSVWERNDDALLRSLIPVGLAGGAAAMLLECGIMADAGVDGAEEAHRRLAGLICEKALWMAPEEQSESADARYTADLSGLLIALCISRTECDCRRELISDCSAALAEREAGGSAAAATAAAALALAARETGCEAACEAACGMLEGLIGSWSEELRGWPDDKEKIKWLAKRGPQTPWIGICALLAAGAAGEAGTAKAQRLQDTALRLLQLSLDSLLGEDELRLSDSLYHGNALSVVFLTMAADHSGESSYMDRAGCILGGIMERSSDLCAAGQAADAGVFSTSPAGIRDFFDASALLGSTGVAMAALYWYIHREELS